MRGRLKANSAFSACSRRSGSQDESLEVVRKLSLQARTDAPLVQPPIFGVVVSERDDGQGDPMSGHRGKLRHLAGGGLRVTNLDE